MDRRHLSLARETDVRYELLIPGETEAMLLVHDGTIISSSFFMLEYISETFPGPALMPLDAFDAYRARAWGQFLGATLGSAPGLFNLWGEAVHGAGALAATAPDDAIQASEQAYLLLRRDFLFRPRGLFHRPRIGDTRTYVLAGRA